MKHIKNKLMALAKKELKVKSLDGFEVEFDELTEAMVEDRRFLDDEKTVALRILVWDRVDGVKSIRFLQEMYI